MSTTAIDIQQNGFLAALFDMSFRSFITTKLVKILYAIGMVLFALVAIGVVLTSFNLSTGIGLLMLIVSPVLYLFMLIYLRVTMELIVVLFRVAEEITSLARRG
jgi:hypothetical protein